jgi:hypothetical protein
MKKLKDESVVSFVVKQGLLKGLESLAVIMIVIILVVGFVYLAVR